MTKTLIILLASLIIADWTCSPETRFVITCIVISALIGIGMFTLWKK